jgi:hypothetical protein
MKFSTGVVDVSAHNTSISNLLADDECIIFLDTNIIFLCFALNDAARNEFFSWLRPLAEKNRIKLPSWCLHEYTSKFNNRQITGSQEENKLVSTITKNFAELQKLLSLSVDEAKAKRQGFATIGDFTNAVSLVQNYFSKLKNILKIDEKLLLEVHDALTQILGPCVLDSNIQQLADLCSQVQIPRFNNRLPPGYKDGGKPENSIGDLIIWNEILEFAKANSLKKIIIISNDEKKDWVYQPYKKIESSHKKPNVSPSINLVDTRLIDEFEKYTTISNPDLFITPFNYLFELIIKASTNNSFDNLKTAIQVAQVSHNVVVEQQSDIDTASNDGVAEVEGLNDTPVLAPGEVEQPPIVVDPQQEDLLSETKADALYEFKNQGLIDIISGLKSSNWYTQNDAISELHSILSITDAVEDLFVLGRNIYQAAEGGSFGASDYIRGLVQRVKYLTEEQIIFLLQGIFFEAYFNSQCHFRQCKGKPDALPTAVSILQAKPKWRPAISSFIKNELRDNENQVLYKWYDNEITDFNFHVIREASDEYFNTYKTKQLFIAGEDITDKFLLCKEDEHSFYLENNISRFFHIPHKYIHITIEGQSADSVPSF